MKDPQDSQRQQLARSQGKAQQGPPQSPPEPPIQQQQYPNQEQYGLGLVDQHNKQYPGAQQSGYSFGKFCLYLIMLFTFIAPIALLVLTGIWFWWFDASAVEKTVLMIVGASLFILPCIMFILSQVNASDVKDDNSQK